MNEKNQIGTATKLFGFIAEKAQSNRFSVTLNKRFKAQGDDAMMIPMNIREDDLYFTVSNMRSSQLKGVVIGVEYQKRVVEILDEQSEAVQKAGFCDTIAIESGKLRGEVRCAEAVLACLKAEGAKRVAVIGGGALSRALALGNDTLELHFFHEEVEALMKMSQVLGREVDVNRLAAGMAVDLGGYDALVDACRMEHLEMITALPTLNVDLRTDDTPSPLRERCRELGMPYTGYEAMLPYLTQSTYDFWMKDN